MSLQHKLTGNISLGFVRVPNSWERVAPSDSSLYEPEATILADGCRTQVLLSIRSTPFGNHRPTRTSFLFITAKRLKQPLPAHQADVNRAQIDMLTTEKVERYSREDGVHWDKDCVVSAIERRDLFSGSGVLLRARRFSISTSVLRKSGISIYFDFRPDDMHTDIVLGMKTNKQPDALWLESLRLLNSSSLAELPSLRAQVSILQDELASDAAMKLKAQVSSLEAALKRHRLTFRLHCRRPPLSSQGRRPRIELSVTRASLDVKAMKLFHLYALISAKACMYKVFILWSPFN
ncbi:UNVERIFIED_CONTAM: hypothetical protein Sradi_6978900 [Sesamum radiatum]|uniref:Uncharacterized protein n=1 Tax=Sesamum radiatum TaxID=300843 RepID=A0AAW2JE39_SESRA